MSAREGGAGGVPDRVSTQPLMPPAAWAPPAVGYDPYPAHELGGAGIGRGFGALGDAVGAAPVARIDGAVGVRWDQLREGLEVALGRRGRTVRWVDVSGALQPTEAIERLLAPYLGGDDRLFGTRCGLHLADLFDPERLRALPRGGGELTVIGGTGAALVDAPGPLLWVDLPRNELQYRSRAGAVRNLAVGDVASPEAQYKRFYFVDWPLQRAHQRSLLERIDHFVDGQWAEAPAVARGADVRAALIRLGRAPWRARPWFEPGPWGGQWLRRHFCEVGRDAPNLAWSFELIAPESGLVFSDGRHRLELSLDWLMQQSARDVLGDAHERFADEFPIRFDFLDTVEGGNLSLQCHPRPEYCRVHFGERFTQDECYYILDAAPGAEVWLALTAEADPPQLRRELERSARDGSAVAVERHVRREPARPHDLFLIPSGTAHAAGAGSLVLEISATPYIFTFKMYDWLRLGLDGRPRPLNIERAFENLLVERRGERARRELVSRPREAGRGEGWRLERLPTHPEHFYGVRRLELEADWRGRTDGSPRVMMVVEGEGVLCETPGGEPRHYRFAETFVVPAAAESFRLSPVGPGPARVVEAFVESPATRGDGY